jgi:hypothetical protein
MRWCERDDEKNTKTLENHVYLFFKYKKAFIFEVVKLTFSTTKHTQITSTGLIQI